MQRDINGHASDECLEQYALGSLEEPLLGEVEEHLLICSQCQEHLKEIDAFRVAMRSAAARLEGEEEARKGFWTQVSTALTFRRLGWVMALGAVVLIGLSVRVWMSPAESSRPLALFLETTRGTEIRHAPARRPLELSLDRTGLALYPSYQVETVDAMGRVQALGAARASEGKVTASLAKGLRPGNYFVRLYSPSRELLREYGLVVD
jgi:anti-sigma factor RsiW